MAILKNVEIWFAKVDPKNPDRKFNKDGQWTCQIRTNNPEQKSEWAKLGLKPVLAIHKEGEEEGMPLLDKEGKKQWRVSLSKRCKKASGEPAEHVKVVDGKLNDIDPRTIGNGSVGNIRIYQYDSKTEEGKKVSMLMAIQLTKHKVYEPRDGENFDFEETEVIGPDSGDDSFESDTAAKPSAPRAPAKTADQHPEDAF